VLRVTVLFALREALGLPGSVILRRKEGRRLASLSLTSLTSVLKLSSPLVGWWVTGRNSGGQGEEDAGVHLRGGGRRVPREEEEGRHIAQNSQN